MVVKCCSILERGILEQAAIDNGNHNSVLDL